MGKGVRVPGCGQRPREGDGGSRRTTLIASSHGCCKGEGPSLWQECSATRAWNRRTVVIKVLRELSQSAYPTRTGSTIQNTWCYPWAILYDLLWLSEHSGFPPEAITCFLGTMWTRESSHWTLCLLLAYKTKYLLIVLFSEETTNVTVSVEFRDFIMNQQKIYH